MKVSSLVVATVAALAETAQAYCNGDGCSGVPQGGEFCNKSAENCAQLSCQVNSQPGTRTWCTNQFNYCHWGPEGDAASSTCNVEETGIQSTEWCNALESQCATCTGRWCTNGNENAPPPSQTPAPIPTASPPHSTTIASTTRYWDCSGGACGCAYLPFGPGTDDRPAHCHSNAMFAAPAGNPYGALFYGAAAVSQALGGGDWLAEGCGKCYKVVGAGNIPGFNQGIETTLVLKATNYCPPSNAACCCGKAHFDIAAPGFDYLDASQSNTCPEREAAESAGFAACGTWMISSQDPTQNCDCSLFNSDVLRVGCENFKSLYWDNVDVSYEEVSCPQELSRLNCWAKNGNAYPNDIPEFCASNVASTSTPAPVTPAPVVTTTTTPAPVITTTTLAPVTTTTTPAPVTTTTTPAPVTTTTTPAPVTTTTPQPVPAPTTKSPTPAPVSGGSMCCSHNYKTCSNVDPNDWCNQSLENCSNCGGILIEEGACTGIAKWQAGCTTDEDCCSPVCVDKGNWNQCM